MRILSALQHGHPASFADGAEAPSVDKLWELEEKVKMPEHASGKEDSLARMQAAKDSMEPHVIGDDISLSNGPQREAALHAVRDCLDLSLFLKKVNSNEMLEPDEMNALLQKMGNCTKRGSRFMKALFGGQDPPFTFQGQLGGHEHGHRRDWEHLDEVCGPVPNVAFGTSSSGRSAAELLTHTGACLSQAGRTLHDTAGHHGIFQGSASVPAMIVAGLPADAFL